MSGLFGFFYLSLRMGADAINSVKHRKFNSEAKKRALQKSKETWVDNNGCSRLTTNDQKVLYTRNNDGDLVLNDVMTGKTIGNFTKEKEREKLKEEKNFSKNNNLSTICIDLKTDGMILGKKYKDVKTGNVYVIREINGKYYYYDYIHRFFVRPTDRQIKFNQELFGEEYIQDMDLVNNQYKDEIFAHFYDNYFNHLYNCLCDLKQ